MCTVAVSDALILVLISGLILWYRLVSVSYYLILVPIPDDIIKDLHISRW